jgi:hypothetical protein
MAHPAVTTSAARRRRRRAAGLAPALALAALPLLAPRAAAQTDYYNTDAGRPITVEDAYPVERRAIELQLAPLRLERTRGGTYTWGLEPELAAGVLPRTQVEVGLPLADVDRAARGHASGLAGVELSALHNLNTETTLPALAVAAHVLLPAGALAADRAYPSLKGIATKTFPWARLHANAQYTFGDATDDGDAGAESGAVELSRWQAGLAVDRTLPLRSLLLTTEVVARRPLAAADVEWAAAAGTRYQLGPRLAVDGGAGYRFTGDDEGWYATFGAAVSIGMPWSPRR